MSILNHSIPSNGHPSFPPDSSQHPPPAPSWQGGAHSLKPFQYPNSSKKASLTISCGDSIKGTDQYPARTAQNGIGNLSHLLADAASTAHINSIEFEPLGLLTDAMVELGNKFSSEQNAAAALEVAVSSAVELDETQIDLIARKMRRLTGFGNLRMENIVDPSLIAGFVISYGTGDSHVIDLSVKGQLAALAAKVEFSDKRRVANHGGQSWSFSK